MHNPLRIGTRGSGLALWQARAVATRLEAAGIASELVIVRTAGDRLQEAPLSEIGGKRLFVKELEEALLRQEIDAAVHSAKDMPALLPEELALAATLPREDPRDALVLPAHGTGGDLPAVLSQLSASPRVGTSSIRRITQLIPLLPGGTFAPIRGNVDSRLRKLDEGQYDVLVLAAAGLRRLGLADRISVAIPARQCVPAPGQGIVALEIRADDEGTRGVLQVVHDHRASVALDAERTVVAALGGGCQLPLGALATLHGDELDLQGIVCAPDGSHMVRSRATGAAADARSIGERVARELADSGAVDILDLVRREQGPVEGSY